MSNSASPNGTTNKFHNSIEQLSFHVSLAGDGKHPLGNPSQNDKNCPPTFQSIRADIDLSRKTSPDSRKPGPFRLPTCNSLLPLFMAGCILLLSNAYRTDTFFLNRTKWGWKWNLPIRTLRNRFRIRTAISVEFWPGILPKREFQKSCRIPV